MTVTRTAKSATTIAGVGAPATDVHRLTYPNKCSILGVRARGRRVCSSLVPYVGPPSHDDGATPAVVTAVPAPVQARYQKADDSQALTWAWGEFQETGQPPSANAIMRRWGIHPRRAGRVREEVFRLAALQQGPPAGVGGQILAFPPGGKVA